MVENPGTATGAGRFRPLNEPAPLAVEAGSGGQPAAVLWRGAYRRVSAIHDSVHGRSPGALAHARRAEAAHRAQNRLAPRCKRATLHGREPMAGHFLNLGQRGAEGLDVCIRNRREERHQHEMGDVFDIAFGRRWEPLERRLLVVTADA